MSRRRWWARALVVVAASCAALVAAPSSQVFAAPGPATEQVESLAIAYRVDRDGTVQVTETIVYRFGESSDRHGIYRDLLVREPYGDDHDQRYDVSDVKVTSPTGADTTVEQEDVLLGGHRTKALRLRIGAPEKTVTSETATYVLSYRLRGAIRYFADHAELYWNATGRGWIAPLQKVEVTVEVPGGVPRATCYAGKLGSTTPCERANLANGKATYTHGTLPTGEQLTIAAWINPGELREGAPFIESAAGPTSTGLLEVLGGLVALVLLVAGAVVLFFRWSGRKSGRPVMTTPPAITAAEARFLLHGYVDGEAIQATLLELALLGAVQLGTDDETTVVLVDPQAAKRSHHRALVRGLFPTLKSGTTVTLQHRRRPLDAQRAMARALRADVTTKNWFAPLPSASRTAPVAGRKLQFVPVFLSMLGLALLGFIAAGIGTAVTDRPLDGILVFVLVVLACTALYVVRRTTSRGRLTRPGRELVVELRSFQRYLETVRAEDLPDHTLVELLPWAMVLDQGDRWEQLLEGGDPVSFFSSVGVFRVGRFRRGVAAFMAGTLIGGSGTAYAGSTGWSSGADSGASGFSGGAGAGDGGGGGGGGSW
ncbi:DUF2207 domain-containing protein [Kribbella sp. DT2]|uniref:DUF2207 domain-containing protein n=1 Tax=Kribbella sp. DT2 TaxID=3393427 RepID=UPI003CEA97E5